MGEREFIAMMAMLMALQALCIDAMLPALGQIAADMGVSDPNSRQLVIGVYMIAGGLGALIPGSLADRFGRRPVVFASLALYLVLALASALVTDFTVLLVLRALHGIGAAGLSVMPSAIIRDRMAGDKMARMQSTIAMVFMLVPAIAPSFGQLILLFASWRWIFGVMAVMAMVMGLWVYLRLPETLHPEHRQEVRPLAIGRNMWEAVTTRAAIGYVLASALVMGGLFGYINCSQQLVAEHLGAGETFPLIFGATALAMAGASFANSRIVEHFGARRVSHAALLAFIAVSAAQLWVASRGNETLWEFIPLMTANMCLIGFIGANFGSIAMQPFARIAGSASSVIAFLRMLIGSSVGALIGAFYDESARPLALGLLATALLSLLLVLFSEHGRLFRRVYPKGAPRAVVEPR